MRRKLKGEPIIMSRKGENIYKRKMDDGKEDTSKHVHRVEKLFTDMYMLPPTKKQKENAASLLLI